MTKVVNPTKVITGKVRFSYCNILEAKATVEGGQEKYSTSIIIPKSDTVTLEKINKAIEAAYNEGEAKLRGTGKTVPALSAIHIPLRDGDVEKADDLAYKDSYFLNASSISAVGIVDAALNPILDPSEIYSGMYGKVSISFYAYNKNGAKGIAVGLNNVLKLADGDHLGGKVSAEKDFATDDTEDFLD
jgi:hypothetical protein